MDTVVIDKGTNTGKTSWVAQKGTTTGEAAWATFEQLLRRSADTTPYCGRMEQSDTATDNVVMKHMAAPHTTGQIGPLLGPGPRLAQIESRFASKHRSKATRKAFDRMYRAVNEAVDSLARSLNVNLAGIVLSGPLVDAQVGDRSVELLIVLYNLPESVYKLSKQLSAEVLYPIFKVHGVFPGIWCIGFDEWKRSVSSPSSAVWTRKQQGVVVFGEESLGQPAG